MKRFSISASVDIVKGKFLNYHQGITFPSYQYDKVEDVNDKFDSLVDAYKSMFEDKKDLKVINIKGDPNGSMVKLVIFSLGDMLYQLSLHDHIDLMDV